MTEQESLHNATALSTSLPTTTNSSFLASTATEDEPVQVTTAPLDFSVSEDAMLPAEIRHQLQKSFNQIESAFRRLYRENLTLHERLEKLEGGDHPESTKLAKRIGASQLSQRIKQQYKDSTSRLVSSLRQSTAPSGVNLTYSSLLPAATTDASSLAEHHQQLVGDSCVPPNLLPSSTSNLQQPHRHRLRSAHRDGIWEVTAFKQFLATASADSSVKIWSNDVQLACILTYTGHTGSVNSVRFRTKDALLLTASGDGTSHLIRLPLDQLTKLNSQQPSALHSLAQALGVNGGGGEDASGRSPLADSFETGGGYPDGEESFTSNDKDVYDTASTPLLHPPISFDQPHAIYHSVSTGGASSQPQSRGGGGSRLVATSSSLAGCDLLPLSAAEFVTDRDHLVTACWDRIGRIYDISSGRQVDSLTGHDDELTDVRCCPDAPALVVTSSRDCTFRLWDFRANKRSVHVQQAHSQDVRSTQFISADRLISAGADKFCRIWDLRSSRDPVTSIRTDSGINRFAIARRPPTITSRSNSPDANVLLGSNNIPISSATSSSVLDSSVIGSSDYCLIALPLDNRFIRMYDQLGNRVARIVRSSRLGHSRTITSVAWAEEGACNFFSAGFDSTLFGWKLRLA